LISIGLVVAAALWPCLTARVISFDDEQYLTNNVLVRNPSWHSAGRFFGEVLAPSTVGGYYQPLTMVSLMLDCARGGTPDNLRAFHETSLALHVVNVWLLVVLLYLLFDNLYVAAAVGLIYGIHPQVVEPITWIADRKTPLATLFALASLILYVRWATRRRGWTLGLCIAAYVLSLLAKPTTIMLPVAFVLLDYWPLRRLSMRTIVEKLPLVAVMIVSAAITYLSQKNTSTIILPKHGEDLPLLLGFCYRIVFYLQKMVLPIDLTPLYPIPDPISLGNPQILVRTIAMVLLAAGVVVSLRRTRAIAVGGLIFLVLLAPTLGAIQFTHMIVADKYVYFPAIGLLIALTWLIDLGWDRLRERKGTAAAGAVLGGTVLIAACFEFAGTRAYLDVWQDVITFDRRKVALAPRSALAQYDLGVTLGSTGQLGEAVACYARALELDPGNAWAHNNLGTAMLNVGRPDEAMTHFLRAVELDPALRNARLNLANLLALQNRFDDAFVQYETLLKPAKPDGGEVNRNYGFALFRAGRYPQAIEQFDRAIAAGGGTARVHCRLGSALAALGRRDEALRHFQEAMKLDPTWPEPAENAARLAASAPAGQ
jgi:Flp pilus assembly protein TadD